MVTFLGHELCEMPIWWRFFSQISWLVPIFQTCEANFSKPRTNTDIMFSLKVAQDPRLHFRRKKFSKKSASWVFFKRIIEKTLFLIIFHLWSPISQNWNRIQGPWFRKLYQSFIGYILALKWRQFFSYLVFLGKKMDKNFFEKFFLIRSSYFSKLIKVQKPFSFEKNSIDIGYFLDQQSYRHQVWRLRFSAKKTSLFSKKLLGSFLLELVYLMTETKYRVHGFVNFMRLM